MPDISQLANYGVAGLAIFFMYKISSNHLHELTLAIRELRDTVKELKEYIVNHTKI